MESISGYISHIIFRNQDNGYTVFEVNREEGSKEDPAEASGEPLVCVGFLRDINEGEAVTLTGEYTEHQLYGQQFTVKEYESRIPEDGEAMIRYLGSGAVKGVGPALARRIVERFKEDTFRIIEDEPERLAEVKGISAKKARDIAVRILEKKELRNAMLFLQKYGIGGALSLKVYKRYGEGLYRILSENPYRLAEDIDGVGFKTADGIAERMGISPDSDHRVRSGVLFVLREALSEGHCYLPKDELTDRSAQLLEVDSEIVWIQVKNLAMDKKVIIKNGEHGVCVYESVFYYLELTCARRLCDLAMVCEENEKTVEKRITRLEKSLKFELDDIQRTAVKKAVMNGVTIITGGPGTGKTTIINMILKYFEDTESDICLCAPTGRAAKRMSEATGYEAQTIQRLLHLTPGSGTEGGGNTGYYYAKNEDEPLEADLVIVDEMSMVDISLFASLLKAILPGTRLVMVGDTDQLPSVGPGAVLKDIISSGCFASSTVILKKIFRQAGESDIIINAHKINRGEHIDLSNKGRDFFFLERNDAGRIIQGIIYLAGEKLPRHLHCTPVDIQVLTPVRKGPLGVDNLNLRLQEAMNPPGRMKKEIGTVNGIIRTGDKVMQIKNNYEMSWIVSNGRGMVTETGEGVYNGDIGRVLSVSSDSAYIRFDDGREAEYKGEALSELELAYAITIHKSQGSEYRAVILPLLSGPRMLMNRNLLYTAVTRAKTMVCILGQSRTVEDMIYNESEEKRNTGFERRIREMAEMDS